MDKKTDIDRVNHLDRVELSPRQIQGRDIRKSFVRGGSPSLEAIATGEPSFWDSAFGRTLKGKNTAGKTLYGALAVGATLLTGINITPVTQALTTPVTQTQLPIMQSINWINLLIYGVMFLIGLFTSRGLVKGLLKLILQEVSDVLTAIKQARQAGSPGGTETTPEEQRLILQRAETLVETLYKRLLRDRLLGFFGLNAHQKVPADER